MHVVNKRLRNNDQQIVESLTVRTLSPTIKRPSDAADPPSAILLMNIP